MRAIASPSNTEILPGRRSGGLVQEVDLLLTGGYVVPMERPGEMLNQAAVAIAGDRIVDVGPAAEVGERVRPARVLDCAGKAVLPGLVDCHVHTCQQLARGLADDVSVLDWLSRIVAFEAAMNEQDVYASVKAACLEMIKSGTTGFVEGCANPFYIDAAGQAIVDSGLRAILTRSTMEIQESDWSAPDPFLMDAEANYNGTRQMIERWNGAANGRISAWASWRQQWNLSDELLVRIVKLAREHGVGIHAHLSTRRYGQIELLDRLGLLGPDLMFAHAIRYTAREVELIALNDVKIDHNPGASMHGAYGSAVAGQYPEMLDKGVCVCLGCDGAANSNTLDMFQAIRLAATLHKEMRQDATVIPATQALQMGTLNGARACQWNDAGALVPGKKADLIVVDLLQPHLMPLHNVINNLVYCASGQDVTTTIVDGRILMENRQVAAMDERRVLAEAAERAERIAAPKR
jgi:5-methylthioadenosine/S-adenosylhomocysteine deaminase